jgi:Flp pilus assembly protein TadD
MTTPAQALDLALRAHRARDHAQAEQPCRQVLQLDPRPVEALHLLGLVTVRLGRHDQAIEYIGQAIRLKPDYAEAHCNLGSVLAGALFDADRAHRRALVFALVTLCDRDFYLVDSAPFKSGPITIVQLQIG